MSRQLKFLMAALGTAWAVDLLFWQSALGINYFLWVLISIVVGFVLAQVQKVQPARLTWLMAGITVVMAAFTFIRSQPFTIFVAILLTLVGMLLLASTFRTANWVFYRLVDYLKSTLLTCVSVLIGTPELLAKPKNTLPEGKETDPIKPISHWRRTLPFIRGVLIALPILFIFGNLLASADPIFGDQLKAWFAWFDIERLGEYLFRLIYIVVIAYALGGIYLHTIHPATEEPRPQPHKDWMIRFLGWPESLIVLAGINLLFIVFVAIQFWYLFGGQANISTTAYTYAEYARRGFNELVMVALLSLGLYLGLATITRMAKPSQQRWFSILSVALILQVLVILTSAFQRLLLYENAYGWTQLRTYTHILMIWIAVLLLAVTVLELLKRRFNFALAALTAVMGFGLTLGLLNVDGFIAQRNIQRAQVGWSLDATYLSNLSTDAVPALVEEYQRAGQPQAVKDALGAELACRAEALSNWRDTGWRAYNLSVVTAESLLKQNQTFWSQYPVTRSGNKLTVKVNGKSQSCQFGFRFLD